MTRTFRTLAAAGAMALALTTPAWGQSCLPSEQGDKQLESQFGERALFEGVTSQGDEIRLFLNPDTGTWTLVVYPSPDIGCGVMSGEGGQPAKPKGDEAAIPPDSLDMFNRAVGDAIAAMGASI